MEKQQSERIAFIGSKSLGLEVLQALHRTLGDRLGLVVTCNDEKDSRGCFESYKEWCAKACKPIVVVSGKSALQRTLTENKIDCAFVAGWYQLISSQLLSLVPRGVYGFHASDLPSLRGNAPLVWAILLGLRESAVSLFKFDEGMDSGPIVGKEKFEIDESDRIADLVEKATASCVRLVTKHATAIVEGNVSLSYQNDTYATYVASRIPDDGLIQWDQSAEEINRLVRAIAPPYPGAFTKLPNGERIRVLRAHVFARPYYGIPGQAVHAVEGKRIICCGESSALVLEEVEHCDNLVLDTANLVKYGSRLAN